MIFDDDNQIFNMRRAFLEEDDLIDEHTQYAVDYTANIKLEKIEYEGKRYVDVLPLLCPK